MKIVVKSEFDSITPFVWEDIPALSIITGLNGAGKSQLLNLIMSNPTIIEGENERNFKSEDITYWGSGGGGFPNESFTFQVYDLVAFAAQIKSFSDPHKSIMKLKAPSNPMIRRQEEEYNKILSQMNIKITGKEPVIINEIEKNSGKHFLNLGFDEIMYYFPDHLFLADHNVSSDRIEMLFYMYHYRKSMDEKKNVKNISNHPTPPWELINSVFAISNLPFEVDNPTYINIDFDLQHVEKFYQPNPKYTYSLKLTHKELGKQISFNSLSSGEKTIMSLAFLLYYAQKKNSFERLLLLDEPDAHLHPSLTKQFLEVVDKFLIQRYGAKVIMTTHSPSTVGLCDEQAIFVMNKRPTKIEKQSREEAIKYLTSGVPVLSSIVDNRRYVFVEDKDDVTYYTKVYNLASKRINDRISLVFIPISAKKIGKSGGYTVVQEWTRKLRTEGGMNLVKGLIDRDRSNGPSDGIYVLKRYSFENYFLDPILVAGHLIHQGLVKDIVGIDFPGKNCNKIEHLAVEELQKIADYIIGEIEIKFDATVAAINLGRGSDNQIVPGSLSANEIEKIEITFLNGKSVLYPKWLIDRRGHDLEAIFRELFGKGKPFGLTPLIDIQERLSEFIPMDLINTLENCIIS